MIGAGRAAVAALLGWATIAGAAAQAPARPNILWIVAEDLSPDLGAYGVAAAHTPNLDRLASEGLRFSHAFAASPLCAPSRSALNTGMYATSIGAHHQRLPDALLPALPPGVEVISDRLRRAGYFTANVRTVAPGVSGTGKTDWAFRYPGEPFDSDRWEELKGRQPFYAQVNFSEAHRPFTSPRRTDPAVVDLPPYYPDHPVTRDDWARYLDDVAELDRRVGLVLERLEREGLADNTIVVFLGDHGREMLRGKQWLYDEGLRVPLIIRWPVGFAAPAGYRAGTVHGELVNLIDLAATTLAWAALPKPAGMQGRVLFGDRAEPPRQFVFGAASRSGEVYIRSRTVRSSRYRYIRNWNPQQPILASSAYRKMSVPGYALVAKLHREARLTPLQRVLVDPRAPEELYDVEADPHQLHNLAGSPAHRVALEELRGELNRWIRETGDRGEMADRPEVVHFFEEYGREGARERMGAIEQTRRQVEEVDANYLRLLREPRGPAPPTSEP